MERRETATMGLLIRVMRQLKPHVAEESLGMRMGEFVVLGFLRDMGGVTSQGRLREALTFDRSNLVLVLNDLEASELVARTRDPADRRRHFVGITSKGERALAKADASFESHADDVLLGLDADERELLAGLLGKALQATYDRAGHVGTVVDEQPAVV